MSTYAFYIAYDGPALEGSQIDVRDLAPALLALSDLFDETNKVLNGGKATISLNVQGSFKSGCFGIDLVVRQDVVSSLLSWLPGAETIATAADLATILGITVLSGGSGLLRVLAWIRGRKITKIAIKDDQAVIHVDDEQLGTEEAVIRLLQNERVRKAIEDTIVKPLRTNGIDTVGIAESADQTTPMTIIPKEEADSFTSPLFEDEELPEREYETTLQLVSLSFQEQNKWRFSDGAAPFYAALSDPVFLQRIDNHEAVFGKDDIITARIRERQRLTKDGIKTERTIIKVLGHQGAVRQLRLPIVGQE